MKGRAAHGDPIAPTTAQEYKSNTRRLLNAWLNACTAEGAPRKVYEFVLWVIAQKPVLAKKTWNKYKAGVNYYLRLGRAGQPQHAAIYDAAIARLEAEGQGGCAKATTQTSALKAKRFPSSDLATIQARLEHTWSIYASQLSDLLHAGCMTGLRLDEWRRAVLVQDADGTGPIILKVVNAKATQGRAHGETRTLTWPTLSDDRVACLRRCLAWAAKAEAQNRFDQEVKAMQRLLRNTCKQIWPRRKERYALYSCRHEFAAQARRVYTLQEVAALMGHGSDTTATQHYGRPTRAHRRLVAAAPFPLPEPNPEEVARVRQLAQRQRERLTALTADRAAGLKANP
jgi:hypothetical protein